MRLRYLQIVSFLLLSTSAILASCGGGGGGGGTPAGTPATSLAMKGTSGNAVNMNGTWNSGCSYDANAQENERTIVTINGGSGAFTVSVWQAATNGNCTQTATPDILVNVTVTATLDSGPTSTAIWVDGNGTIASPPAAISATAKATKATIVYNSATVTLGSDAYVNNFNSGSGFCNQTNWAKGVPKNVLNCTSVIAATTETDYWVVDDAAAQLKWYANNDGIAWHVENVNPMVK